MAKFLAAQLDYIFFVYGLAFILLAASCAIMYRRESSSSLPWAYLGLFGIVHGINEWLDMLAISLPDLPLFRMVRMTIMAVSFVLLLEFGRIGLRNVSGKAPGAWLYLPIAAGLAIAAYGGVSPLAAALRYLLCLPGGCLAAVAFRRAAHSDPAASALSGAAASMVLYTIFAGFIVPAADFFPANIVHQASFQALTGMPVQLLRAATAIACSYYVWRYHLGALQSQLSGIPFDDNNIAMRALIVGAMLLVIGWGATDIFSRLMMREAEAGILLQARYAAAALNPERIRAITGNAGDETAPDYLRIREQLVAFHHLNPRLHLMQLFARQGDSIAVIADSAPTGNIHHQPPGSRFPEPHQELLQTFSSGEGRIVKPHRGIHGIFVSGLAPIVLQTGHPPLAVLGIEIDAGDWQRMEARYRLLAIATTLIFSTFCVMFFVTRQRMIESAKLLEVSRKRYEEAQRQRQLELEEMNSRLEKEVQARTAKLTEMNTELQHFAYVASHDLQEPLRTITSFIQLLARRYQGKLDKDADEFIGFITDGAKRMQNLINDLLAYSRVTSKARPFVEVDCNRVIECALANLRQAIVESGAAINCDPLPRIRGDETQMLQLFQNLLANAIKFRSQEPPRIHVGCIEQENAWEFSVSDNGIGIDQQFHERIFEVFQRLHNRDQYAGTGIGLAVCKKIVARHGGTITVLSQAGHGSCFKFQISKTLSSPEPAP